MKSNVLNKIEHVAEDVGKKTRAYATLGKKGLESAFRKSGRFVREKTSGLTSAISKEKKKIWH